MSTLLIKLIKNRTESHRLREAYANLSGIVGIICNLMLCAVKFAVGALTGAVSVTADAVNNLSDCATNIVTLTGTRLSNKPDDKEHPFGHGRIEYVSALIVAISVFIVSFELFKTSVTKIIHPAAIKFNAVYIVILVLSVLVKLWMAYFNSKLFKLTDNLNLKGVTVDSLSDSVTTAATVFSIIVAHVFNVAIIDGIIGLAISAVIFISGIKILKEVIGPLIGEPPAKETTDRIERIITESDVVLGVHDLIIHNYGANKIIASADAEVDASADIFTLHDVIDSAERKILDELNIIICIHMDPVDTTDREAETLRKTAEEIISAYNASFSFHDFRLVNKDGKKCIEFDLIIPFDGELDKVKIEEDLKSLFSEKCSDVLLDIKIEHSYV